MAPVLDSVIQEQLTSLDDTDCYASAWADALKSAAENNTHVSWGGRGKGGRGLARRTYQPHTVVVKDVRLEYYTDASLPGKTLLRGASLKLLSNHVYALVGRNGCGKSTLLRRIDAGKIPGFPPHLSCMYVPQEVLPDPTMTPTEVVLSHHNIYFQRSREATKARIEQLEVDLEQIDPDDAEQMEKICEQIAVLEDELEGGHDVEVVRQQAKEVLRFFGVDESVWEKPSSELSGGQRKKIGLASSLFCRTDLLLLDEPTNYLDVMGLVQLRQLIDAAQKRNTTVLIVSHDVDLINDVATDVIHFHRAALTYYPGNYRDFIRYKTQHDLHMLRQNATLEKKRETMVQSIENLKKQPTPKRGGAKKLGRQIESRKKKLERHGFEKTASGHRWTAQNAGTGIREGAINGVDASNRTKMSHTALLKLAETNVAPVPDKAVQFVFRNVASTWGEPLIMAMDVGHGYGVKNQTISSSHLPADDYTPVKRDGYLFDCVDLCVEEGSMVCILGEVAAGKSTLLRLLAGKEDPIEGKIHFAQGAKISYFDQHEVDKLVGESIAENSTPLKLLLEKFPKKTEQDIRGELTAFGLDPKQAATKIRFLSGGEKSRLCLANLMLSDPDVLVMDEPSSHLDVESLEAFVYGLKQWNGTVVMVSHDANLIRCIDGHCYVLMKEEGKLRNIPNGIDSYLKSFKMA